MLNGHDMEDAADDEHAPTPLVQSEETVDDSGASDHHVTPAGPQPENISALIDDVALMHAERVQRDGRPEQRAGLEPFREDVARVEPALLETQGARLDELGRLV